MAPTDSCSRLLPGAVYLLSTFYEKKQMAFRTAILYSGSQIGNAVGGLFALAILSMEGIHGISGWRWLFIVEVGLSRCRSVKRPLTQVQGAMTVGLGLIFATFIPNTPKNMRWLDDRERAQLQYRLEVDDPPRTPQKRYPSGKHSSSLEPTRRPGSCVPFST